MLVPIVRQTIIVHEKILMARKKAAITTGAQSPDNAIAAFASKARKILWSLDEGLREDKKSYNKWDARVKYLRESHGMGRRQAIVKASKDFNCLSMLYREFDVSKFDPDPDDAAITGQLRFGSEMFAGVECEGKTLSKIEELEWACSAAGKFFRTKEIPKTCPNDSAFFFFQRATEEGKHFLDKLMQMTIKNIDEDDQKRKATISGRRSVSEIEEMLAILNEKIEEPKKYKRIEKDAEGFKK